ncbi:hypothetical protein F2P81_022599 [Scophthalmus maximus]|uniref:Kelch repeat protein n=1 Tax=Scophthalmus maximus TaxID=52904 RepID=A0A6A4S0Q5_SCOMX|nr:hypothetical protein F2P81_022599 [Scophthalmus maximus]
MHTMTAVSDHSLFVYGGLGRDGSTLNDAWQFSTVRREWTRMTHPHKDKPRVCHTASLGNDNDVVVFGGSSNLCILIDPVRDERESLVLNVSSCYLNIVQHYDFADNRLCEDVIGKHPERFAKQLNWLPSKLRSKVDKRVSFFSNTTPVLTA